MKRRQGIAKLRAFLRCLGAWTIIGEALLIKWPRGLICLIQLDHSIAKQIGAEGGGGLDMWGGGGEGGVKLWQEGGGGGWGERGQYGPPITARFHIFFMLRVGLAPRALPLLTKKHCRGRDLKLYTLT